MDPTLQTLFGWQFILFGLTIASLVFLVRKTVDFFVIPKNSRLWKYLLLPVLPIILGGIVACFFRTFPYPDSLVNRMDRVVFGLVAGLLSTFMYRLVKAFLFPKKQSQTINIIIDGNKSQIIKVE